MDTFRGEESVAGKRAYGDDIPSGACTWLIVKALEKANKVQRQVLETHYGRTHLDSVTIIHDLYKQLDIPNCFFQYREESYKTSRNNVLKSSSKLPKELLLKIVDRVYSMDSVIFI